jgi:hypothetical protein
MPMNKTILFLGLAVIATLLGCELYLLSTYWSTITNTTNSGTIGPLIASIFTPAIAVVTVLFSYLLITVQFERNRELEKVKQRLGEVYKRESDAYFAVWKAIAQAYRLLSELERGTFDTAFAGKDREGLRRGRDLHLHPQRRTPEPVLQLLAEGERIAGAHPGSDHPGRQAGTVGRPHAVAVRRLRADP